MFLFYYRNTEKMPPKSQKGVKGFLPSGEDIHTGTEAWNIAQFFTGFSIAIPLKELNDLEDIARFGSLKMDDDLMMSDDVIDRRRAEAVKRYWQKLRQIISDTLFKVKFSDREKAKSIYEWILKFPKFFDALLSVKQNSVSNEDLIEVNEEFLTEILDRLVQQKQEYLYILDRTGLIFRQQDSVDMNKLMEEFIHGG